MTRGSTNRDLTRMSEIRSVGTAQALPVVRCGRLSSPKELECANLSADSDPLNIMNFVTLVW